MLVLTRKIQQQIQIGETIRITVLQVKGNTVRLGIEAPRDVRVMRCELNVENPLAAKPVAAATTLKARLAEMRNSTTSNIAGFSSPSLTIACRKALNEVTLGQEHVFIAAHAAADVPTWSSRQ